MCGDEVKSFEVCYMLGWFYEVNGDVKNVFVWYEWVLVEFVVIVFEFFDKVFDVCF